jgi:hypothetical protein
MHPEGRVISDSHIGARKQPAGPQPAMEAVILPYSTDYSVEYRIVRQLDSAGIGCIPASSNRADGVLLTSATDAGSAVRILQELGIVFSLVYREVRP